MKTLLVYSLWWQDEIKKPALFIAVWELSWLENRRMFSKDRKEQTSSCGYKRLMDANVSSI